MMKNIFTLIIMAFSTLVFSQANGQFNDVDSQVAKLAKAYNLDQEQSEKLKLMILDKNIGMDQLKKEDFKDENKYSSERFKLNEQYQNALNAMVTDDQKYSYQKHLAEERKKRNYKAKMGEDKKSQNSNLKKN